MESDTPRTDANVINVDYETREPDGEPSQVIEEVVLVDFARQLERELSAAIKQRDEARELYCRQIAYQMGRLTGVFDPKEVAIKRGWVGLFKANEPAPRENEGVGA